MEVFVPNRSTVLCPHLFSRLTILTNLLKSKMMVSRYTKEKIPMAGGESYTPASLSDREVQIIELVAAGLTNHEIAQQLEISKRTVDNHISNILTKTATDNRVALVRWALQWGKVCLNDVNCCPLPTSSNEILS
jgi:DNA-binding NarL/FixJ family response regulator